MIGPSLSNLLFAASDIVQFQSESRRETFQSVASPFWLTFERANDTIALSQGSIRINKGSVQDFVAAVTVDVVNITRRLLSSLPVDDVAHSDLEASVTAFSEASSWCSQ